MSILDWLRKFGVIRYGVKTYKYNSGKDMPAEALMDDVYDAEKDLLFNGDKKKEQSSEIKQKKNKKGVSMWKKILGTIVVFIGILVALVMWGTSGMTDVANEFFVLVKTKNYDDAYNMLSEDFKKSTSEQEFETFLKKSALTNYKDSSWSSRSIEGNIGTLEGKVTTKSGEAIPLTIKFIKGTDDTWKIYSLYKPAGGIQRDNEEKSAVTKNNNSVEKSVIPPKEELMQMVKKDIATFTQSLKEKSMDKFYNNASKLLQKEYSVEKLNSAYSALIKSGIDFTVLNRLQPIIDGEPEVKDGLLRVNLHYNTSPSKAYVKISYHNEDGKWKVAGTSLEVK